jgi:hypothetical protein
MKTLTLFLSILLAIGAVSCSTSSTAQMVEGTALKSLLEAKNFVFQAQSAQPTRGTTRQLSGGYDLRLSGDTLVAQLPYFGRAFSAPIDMRGGGIEFTTADYGYTLESQRKGRWNITIDPKGVKDVRQMTLSVSENGYASLQVLSTNRDPITFNGVVVERRQRQ